MRVERITSFALNPVIKEVMSLQSENPNGMNKKEILLESAANTDSFG